MKTGRNHNKPAHIESRRAFYDWLAKRNHASTASRRSSATRLSTTTSFSAAAFGFITRPTVPALGGLERRRLARSRFRYGGAERAKDISSWLYDHAADKGADHRQPRQGRACYDPGYTFVEKLQTISTKYRKQQETEGFPIDFMRHYYDVYCLLERPDVQAFIGTDAYKAHKDERFRPRRQSEHCRERGLHPERPGNAQAYATAFEDSKALYYGKQADLRAGPRADRPVDRSAVVLSIALRVLNPLGTNGHKLILGFRRAFSCHASSH